jgi:hypothetical protein
MASSTDFDDHGEHDDAIFKELDIYQIHHPSIQQSHDVAVREKTKVQFQVLS